MEPGYFFKRVFYLQGGILLMLLLGINACVDDKVTNISDKVMIDQSF
jgi:hypothetical protein